MFVQSSKIPTDITSKALLVLLLTITLFGSALPGRRLLAGLFYFHDGGMNVMLHC